LLLLLLFLPLAHGIRYQPLNAFLIQSVKHVTDPLLVQVQPVSFIWKVLEKCWLFPSMVENVFCCAPLDVWHCCYLHVGSLDVLENHESFEAYFFLALNHLLIEVNVGRLCFWQICLAILAKKLIKLLLALKLLSKLVNIHFLQLQVILLLAHGFLKIVIFWNFQSA
jgi:hypothetical protein